MRNAMEPSSKPLGDGSRFGVMGGSFNPIHIGHISIAQQIQSALRLETVFLMPAASPPHKQNDPDMASGQHRLEMCRLALQGMRGLEATDYELKRGGVSYTIDTARALREAYGKDAEIRFLIGSDSLAELPTWKDIGELVTIVDFAIAERRACPQTDAVWNHVRENLGREAEEKLRAGVVAIDPVDMSSTEIRERVRKGENLSGLVRYPVAEYIENWKLYQT